jgi:predicted NUDIX family phosphoesterase
MSELVFGVDAKYLSGLILNQSLSGTWEHREYLDYVLRFGYFRPRPEAEVDPSFKQVIPYVALMDSEDRVFTYTRSGTEGRLHGLRSAGIGGHINLEDWGINVADTILKNIQREVTEEVAIVSSDGKEILVDDLKVAGPEAVIYAGPGSVVDEVHLGLLFFCFLPEGASVVMGDEGKDAGFKTFKELQGDFDSLETWLKLVLPFLE